MLKLVRISQKTTIMCLMNIVQLMTLRKIVIVYSENELKLKNIIFGPISELFSVKPGGICLPL
jgi:hypothetical protein